MTQKPKGCIATECGLLDMGVTEECKICFWNKPVHKKITNQQKQQTT